ncbi:hypothetical protein I9W82_002009 [Candida metapsilosis]|uniref:Uncharacterized protein n=1 Tax=Candida metapsilosis TaxID=273372 RepID=A0A8H7ZGI4_9ASCO|nr:hypothetical protein I9W82_002009 [Candida metapsilosis]
MSNNVTYPTKAPPMPPPLAPSSTTSTATLKSKWNDIEMQDQSQSLQPKGKSDPKPRRKDIQINPQVSHEPKIIYCIVTAAILLLSSALMLGLGELPVRMAGTLGMGLVVYLVILLAAVVFDLIEIVGNILFSWCLGVGFLVVLGVSGGLMYLQWVNDKKK